MTFLEKENQLIQKLKETNYDMFDGDSDAALDFVGDKLEKFPNYANIVIRQQIMLPIWKVRYEGEEFRDKVKDIDVSRRYAHESAISSVTILNRFSKKLGLEPFADIDTTDRYAVADFIGQYIGEVYNQGIGKNIDDVTLGKTTEYDSKIPHVRLNEIYKADSHETGEMEM